MASSTRSAKIWPWLAERFFHLRDIESYIKRTNERYLDAQLWASMQGITTDEAEYELLLGVKTGKLQRYFLYEWSDSPVQFIVPEEYVGQKIRLSEIGYIGEDDRRQIEISPFRVRPVFSGIDEGGAMSGAKPQPVSNLPSVRDAALDFARDMVPVQLTKFRFRMGAGFVVAAVLVFLASESLWIGQYFRPEFADRAWLVTNVLFGFGGAFAGKEVIDSLVQAVKSALPKADKH